MNNKETFTFIDLFSGIGGFNIALAKNGGECAGFSEINNAAINVYCENLKEPKEKNLGDIKKIRSLPTHDLLTAGVPCQSWSIAGRNLGFDDDRGQLWNDTIYLLNKSRPKAFVFENVKGLVDPRNKKALSYILERILQAGFHAKVHVVNSYDYGVPQNRVRIFIVGFKEKEYLERFSLPEPIHKKIKLKDILGIDPIDKGNSSYVQRDLFNKKISNRNMSLSNSNGFNDYFLFNDIRNGNTTIHSWDILDTTKRQKDICYSLLKNRRKKIYGELDGNPLSFKHLRSLDQTISQKELNDLVKLEILKEIEYVFQIGHVNKNSLSEQENDILKQSHDNQLHIGHLKTNRSLKLKRISISKSLDLLNEKGILKCKEIRYDFKNTKISTGLFGINRIFLPSSDTFPTLVASDTNDYIAEKDIPCTNHADYKRQFLEQIYRKNNFRKISKKEACLIQGFPPDFKLPESRAKWMKLIGNSVSVPVIDSLCKAIIETGVFSAEASEKQLVNEDTLSVSL